LVKQLFVFGQGKIVKSLKSRKNIMRKG